MLNILIPLAGKSTFETNSANIFPKILSDIGGELLIERAAKPFVKLRRNKRIVVACPNSQISKYKLDSVLPLLAEDVEVCSINGNTKGAVCSALLAIEKIDMDSPLVISSFEQVLDFDIAPYIDKFVDLGVDAGVLTFSAIHPKWSFVRVDKDGYVSQAAEKTPISKNAIAGFYFFSRGSLFVEAAKDMIRKDVKTNDLFFVAPTLNEIILNGGKVLALPIDKDSYFHINDEHALASYEENIKAEKVKKVGQLEEFSTLVLDCLMSKNYKQFESLLSEHPLVKINSDSWTSKSQFDTFYLKIESLFSKSLSRSVSVLNPNKCLVEFGDINDIRLCSFLKWTDDKKIISIEIIQV